MRLLVSPMNMEEAHAALAGGADILDVKNPKEGSLGANFPWVIRSVADLARGKVPVSATIGDMEFKPGTASLAALGAASSGADYVKAGLLGVKTCDQAEEMLKAIGSSSAYLRRVINSAFSPGSSLIFSAIVGGGNSSLIWINREEGLSQKDKEDKKEVF